MNTLTCKVRYALLKRHSMSQHFHDKGTFLGHFVAAARLSKCQHWVHQNLPNISVWGPSCKHHKRRLSKLNHRSWGPKLTLVLPLLQKPLHAISCNFHLYKLLVLPVSSPSIPRDCKAQDHSRPLWLHRFHRAACSATCLN